MKKRNSETLVYRFINSNLVRASFARSNLVKASMIFACLFSFNTVAEISSLSAEELTDTYIKDTTVIVRQPKKEVPKINIPVNLKITPLEQQTQILPQDQMQTITTTNPGIHNYDDLNNFRALDNNLQVGLPSSTGQLIQEPKSAALLQQIQDKYGLDSLPTDLTTLGFNSNMANDISIQSQLPSGTQFSADDRSMTFSIPNLGNFNSQQIKSPNGEIGVNVTPSQIQYTINLPR